MLTVLNVAGARPNFMKIAPLHRAMLASGEIRPVFVHTGQHYDDNMSQVFLEEFDLPEPQFALGVGSGTHAEQTARVMLAIEPVIEETKPDVVLVVGDVNSTVAATLTAVKLGVATAHVEAGLRSFDRTMPEEINRLLTDAIADFLFAPSRDGVVNLRREGIPDERIFFVGNVMIDTLLTLEPRARRSTILGALGLKRQSYVVATLHRPSNVDDAEALTRPWIPPRACLTPCLAEGQGGAHPHQQGAQSRPASARHRQVSEALGRARVSQAHEQQEGGGKAPRSRLSRGIRAREAIRRLAARIYLILGSMRAKELVKCLVYRDLAPVRARDESVDPRTLLQPTEDGGPALRCPYRRWAAPVTSETSSLSSQWSWIARAPASSLGPSTSWASSWAGARR